MSRVAVSNRDPVCAVSTPGMQNSTLFSGYPEREREIYILHLFQPAEMQYLTEILSMQRTLQAPRQYFLIQRSTGGAPPTPAKNGKNRNALHNPHRPPPAAPCAQLPASAARAAAGLTLARRRPRPPEPAGRGPVPSRGPAGLFARLRDSDSDLRPMPWEWVVLACHVAVYGACGCSRGRFVAPAGKLRHLGSDQIRSRQCRVCGVGCHDAAPRVPDGGTCLRAGCTGVSRPRRSELAPMAQS